MIIIIINNIKRNFSFVNKKMKKKGNLFHEVSCQLSRELLFSEILILQRSSSSLIIIPFFINRSAVTPRPSLIFPANVPS
jgi:hypothetical protein